MPKDCAPHRSRDERPFTLMSECCCMPCRLCTRPTIGLEDDSVGLEGCSGNSTTGGACGQGGAAGQRRRALQSKNSVTGMFSAQVLWAAGVPGAGGEDGGV